jgi:hypothetical protein
VLFHIVAVLLISNSSGTTESVRREKVQPPPRVYETDSEPEEEADSKSTASIPNNADLIPGFS